MARGPYVARVCCECGRPGGTAFVMPSADPDVRKHRRGYWHPPCFNRAKRRQARAVIEKGQRP